MDLLETRELRYFVTVAEELHFGRAAQRLTIAQPALSKAIQRIEARLRVQLFSRSSRSVTLTPAGAALLEHGRLALSAVAVAAQSAQRAGHQESLRLILKPGGDAGLLSGILAAYAQHPDARRVDLLFSGGPDRTGQLHDGRADVALLHAPFDDLTGLAYETLHTEDRVAVLPTGHRLARRGTIRRAELAGETFPGDGAVADVAQLVALVAVDRMVAVLPRSLVTPVPPGVACVPVADAEPSYLVAARREDDDRAIVRAFLAAAATPVTPR
ncbi:LysR family transcriptional regulator [Actinoplanes sp. N902-109]|uniref:LysR family transcriptional regulator n=1 Tax=Actinoplanes sp. (strain N902-109) TaxID=649831 RepID=UPI0003294EB5|nr:LysR family transcriptional regulator [Actinoplanes sp. N902-109]AGL20464.1 putative lysR family transcriptional regulator [Actinoplanes sp. N902-109]